MAKTRMPDFYVDDDLAGAVRALAAERGCSYAQLLRTALKLLVQLEVERAVRSARAGVVARTCPVCSAPRRSDAVDDAMAHAQCDQTIATLERTAS